MPIKANVKAAIEQQWLGTGAVVPRHPRLLGPCAASVGLTGSAVCHRHSKGGPNPRQLCCLVSHRLLLLHAAWLGPTAASHHLLVSAEQCSARRCPPIHGAAWGPAIGAAFARQMLLVIGLARYLGLCGDEGAEGEWASVVFKGEGEGGQHAAQREARRRQPFQRMARGAMSTAQGKGLDPRRDASPRLLSMALFARRPAPMTTHRWSAWHAQ